ncbi:hypothetical protein CALVIDRAFT_563391 [Calocera viscosa TUFC12733]|uniref:Uncharacterized protein n=1 Tax=Calocera viscosa (strain TUFC12733) TaxID=1330018 RepID=A0A167MZB6_CALVF|nr:hypothetical protein CALVIDRAFT_563391 [Calocera viscosa TUFC12733]
MAMPISVGLVEELATGAKFTPGRITLITAVELVETFPGEGKDEYHYVATIVDATHATVATLERSAQHAYLSAEPTPPFLARINQYRRRPHHRPGLFELVINQMEVLDNVPSFVPSSFIRAIAPCGATSF